LATQPQPSVRLVFGSFEVNIAAGELRKDGVRVPLAHQPLQVLLLLLAHPGDVVTREQLREKLWTEGTFVDFERGLNTAINKLRRGLLDSAEKPRYIETVPGCGYRFIGVVERRTPASSPLITNATAVIIDPSTPPVPRPGRPAAWITAVAAAMAFGFGLTVPRLVTKPSFVARPVLQFVISPPAGTIFAPPIGRQPFAISPDGTRLAFTATGSNGTNVWIRDLAALNAWPVPGTEGAWTVFWSPDSRSIFYSVKRSLKQASIATSSTRSVSNLPLTTMSGTWRSSGDLVLYLGPHISYELRVESGALRKLPGAEMRWPQFLPHSDHFFHVLFDPAVDRYRAVVTDYVSKNSAPLVETDSRVQYAPPQRAGQPGTLFYVRGASLVIQSFNPSRLRLDGEPLAIVQNIAYFRPSASACFSVSDNGVLVYQAGFPVSELNWYDRTGRAVGAVGRPAPYVGSLRVAPDGQQVAATLWSPENGAWDVWVFEANGRESRRLTYPPASHGRPVWSPEGTRIAFGASHAGPPRLATLEMAEDGKEQVVAKETPIEAPVDQIQLPTDWSSDGRFIAFDTGLGEEEQEVWLSDTSTGKLIPLLHSEFAQWGAVFSRDGKRVAFVSAQSGRPEVYVQAFVSTPSPQLMGSRRQVSKEGAWIVRWRADGRELYYVDTNNWLYAVPVEASLRFGEPQRLFRIAGTPQYGTTSDFQFDVAPDGQRFIMSTTGSATPPPFVVVENWQDKFGR
jgi:eukaryotic-like serine/threonine-protein kinase